MKIYCSLLFVVLVSQTIAVPNRRGTLECLVCRKQDDLTVAECVKNRETETCEQHKPTCMTELWNNNGRIIFSSGCKQSRACSEVEANEPKSNQCDVQPLHVATKCRYCCTIAEELAPGGYCRFPAWKKCVVKGDPHFTTFDQYRYDYSGSCAYTLLQDVSNGPGAVPAYKVSATNMFIGRTARLVDVNITVEGHAVEIGTMIGQNETTVEIRIDGISPVINSFPYELNEGKLVINNTKGGYMTVSAPMAGLIVYWNKKYHLEILHDTTMVMEGRLTIGGMCGNANGDSDFRDELKTRGGQPVEDESEESVNIFASSWEVTGTCVSV
ncbi:hemocytin-like [Saccoglossus kowalevskii]|uniref:IgGFc-binding protein-like n=1 Tax=Saccoglossus kowalevskii TaxID=10224 RepID=A0ABM0MG87_SACKO|nr:PREDICTED: IgGFc-binding protein-like [Saccoglossus kowalevskii]